MVCYCIADLELFWVKARQLFLSMDSTKSTWGQVSLNMSLQGICSHGLHVFFVLGLWLLS